MLAWRTADLLLDGHLSGHLLGGNSRLHRHTGLEGHRGRGVSASLWGLHGAYRGEGEQIVVDLITIKYYSF